MHLNDSIILINQRISNHISPQATLTCSEAICTYKLVSDGGKVALRSKKLHYFIAFFKQISFIVCANFIKYSVGYSLMIETMWDESEVYLQDRRTAIVRNTFRKSQEYNKVVKMDIRKLFVVTCNLKLGFGTGN